jgi:hypothetical protein
MDMAHPPIRRPVAGVPRIDIARPAPVMLPDGVRREPTRPEAHRVDDFEARFDAATLFYDAFRGADGQIVLLGPPFLNLKPAIDGMTVVARPSGAACGFAVREWDRHGQVLVNAPDGTTHLTLRTSFGTLEVAVGPSEVDLFFGRRVLFTLSRNNRLNWIQDWIRFARDVHGADAVLFYDNASTRYSTRELAAAIGAVGGIAVARVVSWPYKYGPQGLDAWRFWDSDYCQHGAWEHARRRFLEAAASAKNGDVDEMVVSADGGSVFEAAENDRFGIVRYRGRWVVGIGEPAAAPPEHVQHTDFATVQRADIRRRFGILPRDVLACPPKWTLVPARCPDNAQWRVHTVDRWPAALRTSARFGYRHFREINDNWKYARTRAERFDPALHETDEVLKAHFARVDWAI